MTRSAVKKRAAISTALMMVATGLMLVLTPSPTSAGIGPPLTEVSIDDDRMITMTTTLPPGVNAFHIVSTKNSAFQLAIRAPGYTKKELASDVNATFGDNDMKALKRFEKNTDFLGGNLSAPDDDAMMSAYLPPDLTGTLMAVDTGARKFRAGKILDLALAGDEATVAAPYDATLRTKGDTTWVRRPATIPREGTLRFVNGATQNHFVVLVKLRKGKTYDDWKAWVRKTMKGERARPPVTFRVGLDSGVLSPSREMTFDYSLPKGNYVLTCFWPDATMQGMPHAFMGMSRPIKLVAGG